MAQVAKAYDLAVIGGGAAGLTAVEVAAQLGARAVLIEKERTGGECTWTGCVPSKALLAAARVAHTARNAAKYGISVGDVRADFPEVMNYVRSTIQEIYQEESPEELRRDGIDVYLASAAFHDPHTLTLSDGGMIKAKYILLCTGARPFIPDGFQDAPYLTNENLFDLQEQPEHLIVVGGGPIGTEMAQAFNRLGSRVTLITDEPRLLPRDEPEASELIMDTLREEGVCLKPGVKATGARGENGEVTVHLEDSTSVTGTHLLIAVGKKVDVSGLNPAAGEIATQGNRLVLKDNLQTSQSHIYAAGDVTGAEQFTHYAALQAAFAVRNMLFPFSSKGFLDTVPWATFTDPEVAHAGLTEEQARRKYGDKVQITCMPMKRADRAMTEGAARGYMKLIHKPDGRLLGATIVGYNAGEMMNEWITVLEKGGKISSVALTPHIYPTLGTANVLLATEQLKKQYESGFTASLMRKIARLKL